MYVLHRDDGSITGVVSGDKHYGADLTRVGHQWIYLASEDASAVSFDTMTTYVDVERKAAGAPHLECLRSMEPLTLTVDKTEIDAGGEDVAHIAGIPAGATVQVVADGQMEFQDVVDDGEIELSAADATVYEVIVSSAPKYLSASVQVVAR